MIKTLFLTTFSTLLMGATCKISAYSAEAKESVSFISDTPTFIYPLEAPAWSKNAVIYEANIRQGTPSGTFREFPFHIAKMKQLGADILWLMPIHPIGVKDRKGSLGSYYSVKDYKGINPEFGDSADFAFILKQAHDMGRKVIIDWVANHTSRDHAWIKDHPDWYKKDSSGNILSPYDWSDVAQLDYGNAAMREEMIRCMEYWVKQFDIDGFRCDVAFLVPLSFWEEARTRLHAIKPMFMLAEMEWNTDLTQNPADYFNKAFDAAYGWDFMGTTQNIAKGKLGITALDEMHDRRNHRFDAKTYTMTFLSNHDENTWNGTTYEKYGNDWKLYSVLAYTIQNSFPLIYMGEEANNQKRLRFFDKDTILSWNDTSNYSWYRTLNALKHQNKALWNGQYGGEMIKLKAVEGKNDSALFAFQRKKDGHEVVVLVNFSEQEQTFQSLDGWQPSLDFGSLWDKKLAFDGKLFHLPPKEFCIYFKNP